MNILVVMIPLSILLLIGAGVAFFWAVEHDQFDDMDTPGLLPLLDTPPTVSASTDPAPAGDVAAQMAPGEPVSDQPTATTLAADAQTPSGPPPDRVD